MSLCKTEKLSEEKKCTFFHNDAYPQENAKIFLLSLTPILRSCLLVDICLGYPASPVISTLFSTYPVSSKCRCLLISGFAFSCSV